MLGARQVNVKSQSELDIGGHETCRWLQTHQTPILTSHQTKMARCRQMMTQARGILAQRMAMANERHHLITRLTCQSAIFMKGSTLQ